VQYLIVILGIIFFVLYKKKNKEMVNSKEEVLPYGRKDYLLTKAENIFFHNLSKATENMDITITFKPRLADLLYIKKGVVNYQSHFNKIKSKHIDFIICERNSMKILLGIELDDSTHNNSKRKDRDAFIERALKDADLPLLRFKVSNLYNIEEMRAEIEKYIK
jgi:hypothetical protein